MSSTSLASTDSPSVVDRALASGGTSGDSIYRAVKDIVAERCTGRGLLLDVGCGVGQLWGYVSSRFDRYLGADVIRHERMPSDLDFVRVDLDAQRVSLPDETADVVAAVETIEHLENPRAFFRELVRLTRPGGWIVVTTPNQLSFLSKLTLLFKNQFNAFQNSCYPAHITALLEVDLRRIAAECRLVDCEIAFTRSGRIPGTSRHFPRWLSRMMPKAFSDNVLLIGRKPNAPNASGERA
jgi:SAM-dependent methyltransferase